jgi:hypothetical protein
MVFGIELRNKMKGGASNFTCSKIVNEELLIKKKKKKDCK